MQTRAAFAENLRCTRRAIDLSQEELPYRVEIDRTHISALERGVYSATIDIVDRLGTSLGIEPADLLARPGRARAI